MFDKEIVDDSWCDFIFCLPLVLDCGFSRESRQSQKATRFGIDKIRAEAAASFQRITPQMIDDAGESEIRKDLPSPWATCPNLQSDSFRLTMDPSLCRLATQSSCSRCDKTSLLLGSHARYGLTNLSPSAAFALFWVRRAWEARQGVF